MNLQQLRERKLVQWSLAYLAGGWLLLQVLDFLAAQFGWPAGLVRGATVFIGVGSSRVDLQACKLEYSIVSPK